MSNQNIKKNCIFAKIACFTTRKQATTVIKKRFTHIGENGYDKSYGHFSRIGCLMQTTTDKRHKIE